MWKVGLDGLLWEFLECQDSMSPWPYPPGFQASDIISHANEWKYFHSGWPIQAMRTMKRANLFMWNCAWIETHCPRKMHFGEIHYILKIFKVRSCDRIICRRNSGWCCRKHWSCNRPNIPLGNRKYTWLKQYHCGIEWKGREGVIIYGVYTLSETVNLAFYMSSSYTDSHERKVQRG